MRTLCHELPAATPGEEVTLEGWVHRRRELSRVTFLVVRDRSGLAQVEPVAGLAPWLSAATAVEVPRVQRTLTLPLASRGAVAFASAGS